MKRLIIVTLLYAFVTSTAYAKDIAVCGPGQGYTYFPNAGLLARTNTPAGEWKKDKPYGFTLSGSLDKLELLIAKPDGTAVSATERGAEIDLVGQTEESITVAVDSPDESVMRYTFIKSVDGPEVIWVTNKFGADIPLIGAYRAPCSLLDLE